jgi:hypothetical protein
MSTTVGKWTLIQWQGNPLHHILLVTFFAVCFTAEVLAVIQLAHIHKSVSPD